MKVLLCTNTFNHVTHGPAKFSNLVLDMNDNVAYPGFEIKILTEDIAVNTPHVFKMHVAIPRLLSPLSQIIRMFLYAKNIRKVRKQYPFDVVIYINSFFGLVDALIPNKVYKTVGMINDDNNIDTSMRNFSWSYVWMKRFFFKQLERRAVAHHDLIVVNSDYLKEKVLLNYTIDPRRLIRLYKSVDMEKTRFNGLRALNDPIKVLFVKSDFKRGGIETLAAAIALIPTIQFEVIIVGPSKENERFIHSLFSELQHCTLTFLSEQSQQVVYEYLSSCDIFCVPSYKEALGVANIEALSFGIPVVTSNVGGIPEIVDYGNGGWLSEPGNPTSLSQALLDCIANKELRLAKVNAGYEFVNVNFDKKNMFDCLYQTMQKLTSSLN